MTQAIVTKFHGPTNSGGGRIRATAYAGFTTIPYNYSLSSADNHEEAAKALAAKLGWHGKFIAGGSPDGSGYIFVDQAASDVWFATYPAD